MKAYKTVGTILKTDISATKIISKKNAQNIQAILGIDPGLANLGLGVIYFDSQQKITPIEIGKRKKELIFTNESIGETIQKYSYLLFKIKANRCTSEKLFFIFESLCEILETYKPTHIIVEDAFVGINKNSALKLGLARGAILSAIGKYKIPFTTVSPKQIKMEITGKGDAQKEDIQASFSKLLRNWPEEMQFDSSDALAGAFWGVKWLQHKKLESEIKIE
jgi:crossover junction endodeoxyribonuclease RuvC